MDNSSETSESQSIDIHSIKINNHVPNDCESLPIDFDEIATRRERENDKSGSEKRRKKERKSEKKTERKVRRNSARKSESEKRNESVLTVHMG